MLIPMKCFVDERKNEAQKYLEQISGIEDKIRRKLSEKRRWFEIATNTASNMSDDVKVQSSGSKEKMADAIVTGIVDDGKIDKEIAKLKAQRQKIVDLIESLPEPYSDVLYRVYVEYQMLKEVSYSRKESYSLISKVHSIGLIMVYDLLVDKMLLNDNK